MPKVVHEILNHSFIPGVIVYHWTGKTASTIESWFRDGDPNYDHLRLIEWNNEYYIMATGRTNGNNWQGFKIKASIEAVKKMNYEEICLAYEKYLLEGERTI